MGLNTMWMSPLRIAQLIFAMIVIGVAVNLLHVLSDGALNAYHDSYTMYLGMIFGFFRTFKYLIFAAAWTLLFTSFLLLIDILSSDGSLYHPYFAIILEALSWIFWLAAFATSAHKNHIACHGQIAWDRHAVCPKINTVLVFSLFEWLLFTATLIGSLLALNSARNNRLDFLKQGPASSAPKDVHRLEQRELEYSSLMSSIRSCGHGVGDNDAGGLEGDAW